MKRIAWQYFFLLVFLNIACSGKKDMARLSELYDQASKGSKINPEESLKLIDAHNSLAREINEKAQLGNGYYLKAWIYEKQHDYSNALVNYYNALSQYTAADESALSASVLKNIGRLFYYSKSYQLSIDYYQKTLQLAVDANDERQIASASYNIGLSMKMLGKLDSAQYYYLQGLIPREKLGDYAGLAGIYNDMGMINLDLQEYDVALKKFTDAIEMLDRIDGEDPLRAKLLNNIGYARLQLHQPAAAKQYFLQSLALKEKVGNIEQAASTFNNLGIIALQDGDTVGAKKLFRKSLMANSGMYNAEELLVSWEAMEKVFRSQGLIDSAYAYAQDIKDITVPAFRLREKLERDSQKYQMELIDAEYQAQRARVDQRRKIWIILGIASAIILVLVASALTWYYSIRRHGITDSAILKLLPEGLQFKIAHLKYERDELKRTLDEQSRTRRQANMTINR